MAGLGRVAALSAVWVMALSLVGSPKAVERRAELTAGLPRRDALSGMGVAVLSVEGKATPVGRFRGSDPAWTRNGTRLAFVSRGRIWVSAPNGAGATPVTPDRMSAGDPDWSPDARRIVFECYSSSGPMVGICLVGADGRGLRLLVRAPPPLEGDYDVHSPRWSPVGDEIVFVRSESAWPYPDLLQLVRLDDPRPRPLTTTGRASDPTWDPSGTRLAYLHRRQGTCWIELIKRTGSVERRLLEEPHRDAKGVPQCPYELAWSPNGREIAYAIGRAGIRIELVRVDRQASTRLFAVDLPHPLVGLAWRSNP